MVKEDLFGIKILLKNDEVVDGHDTIDLTRNIKLGTYESNLEDVYDEYTDVRKMKHRQVIGRKLTGSFSLIFDSMQGRLLYRDAPPPSPIVVIPTEYYIIGYESFVEALKNYRDPTDGSYMCKAYVNNVDKVYEVKMLLDIKLRDEIPDILRGNITTEINVNFESIEYVTEA